MICPQCQRKAPPHRERCLYCGADLDRNDATKADVLATNRSTTPLSDNGATISIEEKEEKTAIARLTGLPEPLRQKALEALKEKGKAVKIDEQIFSKDFSDLKAGALMASASLKESLDALKRIKEQFDSDRIDYDMYRRMVIETIKGYIEGLDDKAKITYVANDIKGTEVFSYLDEDMHRELLKYAVTVASGTDKG